MSVRHHFLIGALLISCGITPARERPDDDGIPTLPELNQKFAQADRLAANGRFDLVAKLYQSSLKSAHGKLITQPAWETPTDERVYIRYRPAREAIERQLAKLPPEGLAAYRLLADGDAEAVLSRLGPAKREEALGIIASQHFLSSLGDNASLELAGLHLDRFEFEPAIRHLRRVLDLYPDPSINLGFARLRLAAALTLSGKETALSTLLEKTPPPEHLLKPIRAIAARTTATGPNAVEPTPAPQVPIDVGNLRPAWNHPFTLRQPPHWPVGFLEHLPIEQEDEDLEELREEHRWFPTTRLLSTPGALLFKTNERLVCCDPATGTLRWLGFRNHFVLDGVSGVYRLWSRVSWTRDMLLNPEEAQLFGDHVMSQFSLLPSGHVANLEGPHVTGENLPKKKGARPNIDWFGGPQAAVDTRARPNQLMVYRVQDGLVTLRFDAEEFAESDSACFMAAPIAHADTLILPLLDEKKLSLLGITVDFATHRYELRWRTFLTAETLDAVARFAAVGLAHSPNGITVASGNGVIHQIDPASGAVRWAFTYPRSIRENSQVPHRFDPYKKNGRLGDRSRRHHPPRPPRPSLRPQRRPSPRPHHRHPQLGNRPRQTHLSGWYPRRRSRPRRTRPRNRHQPS